jgi:hypothetical protein
VTFPSSTRIVVALPRVEDSNAGFVGRGAGLGSVVDEVVGEQFVEQNEIALIPVRNSSQSSCPRNEDDPRSQRDYN